MLTRFVLCLPVFFWILTFQTGLAGNGYNLSDPLLSVDQVVRDTVPKKDRYGDFLNDRSTNPFDLNDPNIIEQEVQYDPETDRYVIYEKVGDDYFRYPTYMTFEEYLEWRAKKQEQAYFNSLTGVHNDFITYDARTDPVEQFDVNTNLIERLFGGTGVQIIPKGNIDITLGYDYQKIENPNLPIRNQRQGIFDFDMDIQMNVTGKIGEKLSLNTNYNTNATFDFENQLKLKFDSEAFSEDDIIKSIEAGNVTLPLRSNLIQGSQSLFGVKTELQFGHLRITALASQQRSRRENITLQGGAQLQTYEIYADEYDGNRHHLLSHYNRNTFEESLNNLPILNSLFRVTRIEVWVTSIGNEFRNLREVVGFADIGEYEVFTTADAEDRWSLDGPPPPDLQDKFRENIIPDNTSNKLYRQLVRDSSSTRHLNSVTQTLQGPAYNMQAGRDFEQRRARRLDPSRYTLIPELGVLSLDVALRPDEVLAVAYQYTYDGENYQVGEFAADVPSFSGDTTQPRNNILFLKLLKTSTQNVGQPMWDLMMKNFYNIGAYQASQEDFQFDIYYDDPAGGQKRFLPEDDPRFNQPLLSLFNLDNLNLYGDPVPDGVFDFIPGITINPRTGKVMFPVLEPFGTSLEELLGDDELYQKYEYQLLYDTTKFIAMEYQEKNRFLLKGSYKSSVTSEISLGAFNIPPGSVTVRSGGTILVENQDYIVDYQIGRVRIINDAYLSSGAPINISFEDQTLFSFNTQSMLGLRADYEINKKMSVGATYMQLWERPFTQKVNFGDDPINNKIIGADFAYSSDAPWLTKAVDAIPGISTKAPSNVDLYVEGATLIPGFANAINLGDEEGGVVYLDDFDGSATRYDLRTPTNNWVLASVPEGSELFPEASLLDDRRIGSNRALLNWYRIERNIPGSNNDPYSRFIPQAEVFPNQPEVPNLFDFRTFDLTYYPDRRGPYNFDPTDGTEYSAGLEEVDGEIRLKDPDSRWGGIMRSLPINDFEAANYEFIEFWMLNPFIGEREQEGGKLYINLGTISEDIQKDGQNFAENGLPIQGDLLPLDTTNLSRYSIIPPVINAFSNIEEDRLLQDVGLDGFDNDGEELWFADYLQDLTSNFPAVVLEEILDDPANDDYVWFSDEVFDGTDADIFERYRRFNHPQGNSPFNTGDATQRFSNSYTQFPDQEDINLDGSTEKSEAYFEYEIPIRSDGNQRLALNDFVTDTVFNPDGRIWYQFRIPIKEWDRKVGSINDFRSVRFMRMYLREFDELVTLRFATLDLVRNQWRRVTRLFENLPPSPQPPTESEFLLGDVNLDRDGGRVPFRYINPPGIQREQNFQSSFQNDLLNEASLSLRMCNLNIGHSNSIFKTLNFDMRFYERMKLFVHAESLDGIEDGDLTFFMRLGSDYTNNYYEIEYPLVLSELNDPQDYQRVVWRIENDLDVKLEEFKNTKLERNDVGFPIDDVYAVQYSDDETRTIKVKGNPNLGYVQTILIGVRNSSRRSDFCAEVWVNELRLTGLDEQGGSAGLARLDMQLADLGNFSASGNFSSIGWGALDQKIQERSRDARSQIDLATNLELGKFFGEDSGIRIPFFAQYSNAVSKPQFNPYDLDVELEESLDRADTPEERDSIRDQSVTRTTIKSIAFTNVRKERTGGRDKKPMPWDISNFALSYGFNDTKYSDPILQADNQRRHTGALDYRFNIGSGKYIEPFKNLIKTDKWVKFIKDFNFNPIPNSFSFRTTMDKQYRERQFRFAADEFQKAVARQWLWDRNYDLTWNLTRSIRFNYTARNQAVIDELTETGFDWINDVQLDPSRETRRDYVWDNIKDFGRTKNFTQTMSFAYQLPFEKFGILDWINIDLKYDVDYTWSAAAINALEFGNSISNNRRESVRANFNFDRLYAKWSFLDKIQGGGQGSKRGGARSRSRTPTQSSPQGGQDDKAKSGEVPGIVKALVRPLLLVRKGRFNYQRTRSTFLPGLEFLPSLFGMGAGFDEPGAGFIFGAQPNNNWLLDKAENEGWFSPHICQYQDVIRDDALRWDAELTIEPFRDFRIDVTMEKDRRSSSTVLFKNYGPDDETEEWGFGRENEFGSYRISYWNLQTLFKDSEEEINEVFDQFKANLSTISLRLDPDGDPHPIYGNDFVEGYGQAQQEVIIPAFLSAYRNEDAERTKLRILDVIPKPNWRLTYNGLSRLPWFEDIFARVSISHGYNSSMTVNSYNTDLRYRELEDGTPDFENNLDSVSFDYYARLTIPSLVVQEAFSPLIRIDVTTKGDVSMNFEMKKARTLALNPTSQELNETRTSDYTFGFGYTLKNVQLFGKKENNRNGRGRRGQNTRDPATQQNQTQQKSNDLRITCDVSVRDDRTQQHRWGIDVRARDARGQKSIRINPAVEYDLNKNMTLRFFFDYFRTIPYSTQAFPITNIQSGVRFRFTFN
jgi:cell surface protein SprA